MEQTNSLPFSLFSVITPIYYHSQNIFKKNLYVVSHRASNRFCSASQTNNVHKAATIKLVS